MDDDPKGTGLFRSGAEQNQRATGPMPLIESSPAMLEIAH
jgi:hypothetical protein